jgi:hypothetical protein
MSREEFVRGGDREEKRRLEYERWELEQAASGLPEEEWEPFVPSDHDGIIRNLKRPKEETPKERWERIEEERRGKEIKKAQRAAKKLRKEGKMRAISSYFNK